MNSELIFRVFFLALFILVIFIRGYYTRKVQRSGERYFSIDKKSIEREGRLSIVLRISLFFFGAAAVITYAIYPPWMTWFTLPFPIWLRWIGVGLGLLCLPLLIWVQRALGEYWSTELELRGEHALITSGPYRWVRHPMYTAIFTLLIASSLGSANWLIALSCIVAIIVIYARIGKEEQMMIDRFGDEYRAYMQRTGRLLPRFIRKEE